METKILDCFQSKRGDVFSLKNCVAMCLAVFSAIAMAESSQASNEIYPVIDADGKWVFPFSQSQSPQVTCAALQVCDLQLEAGEVITKLDIEDPMHWSVDTTFSGDVERRIQHLIVMPIEIGLATSLFVKTNRRAYKIGLTSRKTESMSHVVFDYADANKEKEASKAMDIVITPGVAPEKTIASTEHLLSAKPSKKEQAPIEPTPIKDIPKWTLTSGHAIGQELKKWGSQSGWNVIWNLPRDVIVPSNTEFVGEFKAAATNVIETLAANGVLIHAKFYDGNKTMVINGPGVVPQN